MTTAELVQEPDLTPVQKFGEAIADRVERWMPSPFLFAILLTYVAAGAAALSEGASATEIALSWHGGFWALLQFAMQMVIILVTANVVAYHPRVRSVILALVRIPKNGRQAVVLVGIGSMLTGWISWGLGLIFGAILAREMGKHAAKNGMPVHYPLLAVAGYMGMSLTWGWGLSSSAGLLQATEDNALMQMGFVDRVIPSTEWVFHPYPLMLTALSLVVGSILLFLLAPPDENCREMWRYVDLDDDDTGSTPDTGATVEEPAAVRSRQAGVVKPLADRIDNSRILGGVIALTGTVLFLRAFFTEGLGALDLNNFNFGFLMIGMLLFVSPTNYLREFYDAVQGSAGVILLFPFYAGNHRHHDRDRTGRHDDRVFALDRNYRDLRGHSLDHGRRAQHLRAFGRRRVGDHRRPHDAGRRRARNPSRADDRGLCRRGRAHQPPQPVLGDPITRDHGAPGSRHVRLRDHHDDLAHPVPSHRVIPPSVLGICRAAADL